MRCLMFKPGQIVGTQRTMNEAQISASVGGFPDIYCQGYRGKELLVYTGGHAAKSRGEDANRIIDGREVYGTIVVVVDNLTPLMIEKFRVNNIFPRAIAARSEPNKERRNAV